MTDQNNILVTGQRSYALGIDAKVIPAGICNHQRKREIDKQAIQDSIEFRIPVPENKWTHCIFYCKGECMFAGCCEYKNDYIQ